MYEEIKESRGRARKYYRLNDKRNDEKQEEGRRGGKKGGKLEPVRISVGWKE